MAKPMAKPGRKGFFFQMNLPNRFFIVTPQVFRVNESVTITLHGLHGWGRRPSNSAQWGKLWLKWIASSGCLVNGDFAEWNVFNESPVEIDRNDPDTIRFTLFSEEEGEISCYLMLTGDNGSQTEIAFFTVYALREDLLELRPMRGDLHSHCSWSCCCRQDENQYSLAVRGRERGLDFLGITDHLQIKPSQRARKFIQDFETDFQVVPGEEIHILRNQVPCLDHHHGWQPHVHIVNFGGQSSVAAYMNEHFAEVSASWKKAAEALPVSYSSGMRYTMAATDWIFDKIREFGGLSVFCHPFWTTFARFNLPVKLNEYILDRQKYDAMEVFGLGGVHNASFNESNQLALAWWQAESIRRGHLIPLVGTSDSHDSAVLFGTRSTIVFTASGNNGIGDIQEAIRQGRSVAVVSEPGNEPEIFGDFRLVRYAYFLWRNYYPLHDAICAAEAVMIADVLNGLGEKNDICRRRLRKENQLFWGK